MMNTADLFGAQMLAIVAFTLILIVWLLGLIHAVQRIDDPLLRTKWVLLFVLLNLVAVVLYILTDYRILRKQGKGHLLRGERDQA